MMPEGDILSDMAANPLRWWAEAVKNATAPGLVPEPLGKNDNTKAEIRR